MSEQQVPRVHAAVREEEPLCLPIDWSKISAGEAQRIFSNVRGLSADTRVQLQQVASTAG